MDSRESLIDLVFAKCALVYGRDFLSRWEGQNLSEVRADWQRELGRVLDNPQSIRHALENLPADRPPTVLQFRALCINRPDYAPQPQLPAPKASAQAVEAAVGHVLTGPKATDPKAWAHRLRARDQQCERLTKFQRDSWRRALA